MTFWSLTFGSTPVWWEAVTNITSKLSGAYALLSGRRWAWTHFSRPRSIGAPIWSSVSWFQWQSVEVRLDRHRRASGGRFSRLWPSLEGLDSSPGAWGAHFYGKADGARNTFGAAGRVWATALRLDPPKKALCHPCPVGGTCDEYRNLQAVWQYRKDIHSVYLFCYCNIFVSTYFSCLRVFILIS